MARLKWAGTAGFSPSVVIDAADKWTIPHASDPANRASEFWIFLLQIRQKWGNSSDCAGPITCGSWHVVQLLLERGSSQLKQFLFYNLSPDEVANEQPRRCRDRELWRRRSRSREIFQSQLLSWTGAPLAVQPHNLKRETLC